MTLGFSEAGFEPIFAVDNDEWSVRTYNINSLGGHAVCLPIESVGTFPLAEILIGGPPCQGFSPLGRNDPADPLNTLWMEFLRAVRGVKPLVFVMENVPQLLKSREFAAFKQALPNEYRVSARVLNAADHGVPQTRRRAIVIGSRICDPSTLFPEEEFQEQGSLFCVNPWRTVRWAFTDIPLLPKDDGSARWDPFEPKAGVRLHVGRQPTPISLRRYRAIPEGGNRFDLQRALPDLTPPCWLRKDRGGTDLFGRLWWDRPSVTIRTEFFKPEKGRYLHPSEDRPITIQEAAVIQSFPDDYLFLGSKTSVARQIGNAVPPRMAHKLAVKIATALGTINSEVSAAGVR